MKGPEDALIRQPMRPEEVLANRFNNILLEDNNQRRY